MGWVSLCLEKRNNYRTLLRCRWHILRLSHVGASQRRFSNGSTLDGATESGMVQLPGHVPIHGIDVDYHVLHAHLFPSCTKCDTKYEWGLYPSRNPKSDIVCDCFWSLGYDPPIQCCVLLVKMIMQLLTGLSWQTWILPTLEHCQRDFDIDRHRSNIDIHTYDVNWHLDRLPNHCRRWPWLWSANGRCPVRDCNEGTLLESTNIVDFSPW